VGVVWVFKRVTGKLYKFVEALSVLFVAGMVGTICYVVFMRYIVNKAPRWGEEVALECMVWFALLSSSLAIWDDRHIRVTAWDMVLSKKALRLLDLTAHLFLFGIIAMMFCYSIPLLKIVAPSRMSGTGISYAYMYGALPVSSVFMLIATIERLGDIFGGKS
jgi:TRAP-type C4-dicarboxylate transport system permease small subunit